jgi:hypothetical protein
MTFKKDEADINFELPIVETTKLSKPRVHLSDDVCISCQS